MAAAMARPWPVLPEVGSTIVPPGRSFPARSAASIIRTPIRSFTLPPGFSISSLARIVGFTPAVTCDSRTSGVFPIASRKDPRTSTGPIVSLRGGRWPGSVGPGRSGERKAPDAAGVAEVEVPPGPDLHGQDPGAPLLQRLRRHLAPC